MSIGCVYSIGCFYKKNYFFYSRHFSFLTTNNNFSTFWCWCFQPRFVFKKVENLRICGPFFDFFSKKKVFLAKKYVFDDFEAFLWHFDFTTIIDSFSTFFRRYFQPQKYFKKIENLSICRPVDFILAKKRQYFSACFQI